MKKLLLLGLLHGCATPYFLGGDCKSDVFCRNSKKNNVADKRDLKEVNEAAIEQALNPPKQLSDFEWFEEYQSVVKKADKEEKTDFIKDLCNGRNDSTCKNEYRKMLIARMEEEYPNADYAESNRTCRAHPKQCKTLVEMEYIIFNSNQDNIRRQRQDQELKVAQQERERRRQFWAEFAQSLNNSSVHCSSRQIGSTTYTDCN